MRTRYQPPAVEAPSPDPSADADVAAIFGRPLQGVFVPWVLGEVAANSAPEPKRPSDEELARIYEEARELGLAEGRAAAATELAELEQRLTEQVRTTLMELASVRAAMVEAMREELLELTVVVAESAMQRELDGGRLTVEPLLGQALLELDPHETCTISVASDEHSWVVEWAKGSWPAALVRADPALGRGELRIDAARGRIEADRTQRMDRIRRMLAGGTA